MIAFDILFVVFLVIFSLTALLTILSLPGWVKLEEGYKKKLFNILLVEVVISIFALFQFYKDQKYFEVVTDIEDVKIWGETRSTYRAYNDSWILEMQNPKKYLETHQIRYSDTTDQAGLYKFAFYLGHSKEDLDISSYSRFVRFQAMVHLGLTEKDVKNDSIFLRRYLSKKEQLPQTLGKISVTLLYDKPPNLTYFLARKANYFSDKLDQKKYSIIYLSMDKNANKSIPYQILITQHEGLFNYLTNHWISSTSNVPNDVDVLNLSGYEIFEKYFYLQKAQEMVEGNPDKPQVNL